jgi:hypothetical protein
MEPCFTSKIMIRTSPKRGFALLITITLLAFLVLLLVSLASLTRVETQVAANGQKLAQARQNALMALNIAVGQLQKYAGPDDRVTALSGLAASTTNPNITGVWSSGNAGAEPDMWLVSGSEAGATASKVLAALGDPAVDITPGSASTSTDVFLVGDRSVSMKAQRVKVAKQPIQAPAGSVPGLGAGATPKIGNYAWWVGDQGVKASLGLPDRHNEVTYGPWADVETRKRLRQQIGSGANYFRQTSGASYGFDPLAAGNKARIANIQSYGQMALLTPSASSDLPTYLKDYFHDFTTASYSVLANTEPGSVAYRGLLRDLSMMPSALGTAFAAYADYSSYMVAPAEGELTRKYRMQPFASATGAASGLPKIGFGVAPVISDLLLRFRVSRFDNNSVVVRSKIFVSLWNPYTSVLVPEDLYLEITGLPTVSLSDNSEGSVASSLNLQGADTIPTVLRKGDGTGTLRIKLKFDPSAANGSAEDKASWLPGRVYSWATGSDNSATLQFYTQDSQATSGTGWSYMNVPQPAGTHGILVSGPEVTTLTVSLLNAAGAVLAKSSGLAYPALSSGVNSDGWKFGYGFRIDQPNTMTKSRSWHRQTADLRAIPVEKGQLIAFDNSLGATPASYNQTIDPAGMNQYLVYRPMSGGGAQSTGHDVSLFELPRQPILSVGELQHLDLPGSKIFSIGNSWGGSANSGGAINANSLFDRFFFSGLMPGIAGPGSAGSAPLPNWNMRMTDATDIATVRTIGESTGYSSLHFLQGGGFNFNSTSVAAWQAMLSRIRFDSTDPFTYVQTSSSSGASSGTQSDGLDQDPTLGTGIPAPVFFRFPQSAQETRDWSTVSGRQMDTQAFRQGVRGGGDDSAVAVRALTTTQIETLANKIVGLIKLHGSSGPFRSISEFLNPSALFGNAGLLEKAIETAGINPPELTPAATVASVSSPGFSSLTLTAADIMGGLAPFAKVRSDTFLVRTFGDTTNPVTGESEGRAYLEAIVQRLPEPLAASDLVSIQTQAQPSGVMGRRFKIISFRWLNESDI